MALTMLGFNRYIVECKYNDSISLATSTGDLIDT